MSKIDDFVAKIEKHIKCYGYYTYNPSMASEDEVFEISELAQIITAIKNKGLEVEPIRNNSSIDFKRASRTQAKNLIEEALQIASTAPAQSIPSAPAPIARRCNCDLKDLASSGCKCGGT